MRKPAYSPSRQLKLSTASIPSPVGGWNARDSFADMDPMDAVFLKNYYPGTNDVSARKGCTQYIGNLPDQVETLMVYSGGNNEKMFCVSDGGVYNASSTTISTITWDLYIDGVFVRTNTSNISGTPEAIVEGYSNSRFQYVNISTSGGSFLLAVNGEDKLIGYDGTDWYQDGDAAHDISGVDTSTLINIHLHKHRVWLVQKNTLNAWYLGTDSISGSATAFPLKGVAQKGGYLVAMATWTIDAGYGVDDLAVFITNHGEVIVYRGTDPSSADTWALVGIWNIGSPVGYRCFLKYSGDLLLICQDGVLPLSSALQSSRVNPKVSITDKIQSAVSTSVTSYGDHFGWQLIHFPAENQLYLNVPIQEGQNQQQYVMNTITKAWGQFLGWEANCWAMYNEKLYFGSDGVVFRAWDGYSDDGNNITSDCLQAFNYFKRPTQIKQWTLMRPIFRTDGTPKVSASLNIDFDDSAPTETLSFTPSATGIWDESLWDQAVWGSGLTITKAWRSVSGLGYCAAPRIKSVSQGIQTRWISTDVAFKSGGIL